MEREQNIFKNIKEIPGRIFKKENNVMTTNIVREQLEEYIQAQKSFNKKDISLKLLARPGDSYIDSEGNSFVLNEDLFRVEVNYKNKKTLMNYINNVNGITLSRFYSDNVIDEEIVTKVKELDNNRNIQIKPIDISVDQ